MTARVFLDTNFLAYLFDDAEPRKQAAAEQRLERERLDAELVVSTQVLQELYVCLTREPDPIANPELARKAVHAAAELSVVQVDVPMVLAAIERARAHSLSFWDALIVGAARVGGCERILTEDLNGGQEIDGVRIENPFREA